MPILLLALSQGSKRAFPCVSLRVYCCTCRCWRSASSARCVHRAAVPHPNERRGFRAAQLWARERDRDKLARGGKLVELRSKGVTAGDEVRWREW